MSPSQLENPFQLVNDFLRIYISGWNFHSGWLFLSLPKFRQKVSCLLLLGSGGGGVKAFFNTCSTLQSFTNLRPCGSYLKVVKHHLCTIITLQSFAFPWRTAHSVKLWMLAKNITFFWHGLPVGSLLALAQPCSVWDLPGAVGGSLLWHLEQLLPLLLLWAGCLQGCSFQIFSLPSPAAVPFPLLNHDMPEELPLLLMG